MKQFWNFKTLLLIIALLVLGSSLYYISSLVKDMEAEERNRVALLVEGIETLTNVYNNVEPNADFTYISKVIDQNRSIPLIITDANDEIISTANIDSTKIQTRKNYIHNKLEEFKIANDPIIITAFNIENRVYYGDSHVLASLRYYPFVLIIIIVILSIVFFVTIYNMQRSIQNQLWVGFSKETAHQLGTPLTSIVGWMELLRDHEENREWIDEMEKDVKRLQLVADRFSKIGSVPQLENENIYEHLSFMVDYMQKRSPQKVNISLQANETEVEYLLSAPLFNWVIENLIRNALDAMEGKGEIKIVLENTPRVIIIDICDTGKGIPKGYFKKVFTPGFSTKKRGWGLGLSLAKRIIEQFHNGNIFVKRSELGIGTTFRIVMRR